MTIAPHILVDADACPVKDEIYKVAWRMEVPVTLVSNAHLRVPQHPLITRMVVRDGFDASGATWPYARSEVECAATAGDQH